MEFAAAAAKAPGHNANNTMDTSGVTQPATTFNGSRQPRASSIYETAEWAHDSEKKDGFQITESERFGSSSKGSSSSVNEKLKHVETFQTSFEASAQDGVLYRNGELVLMPAPTKDPRDPLNLPFARKILACICLCCFGALAAAAELILGSMLPVFALEYAGIDPKFLKGFTAAGGLPAGSDPLKTLENLPNAKPIWEIYLLASLPVLIIGVANLVLVPMAISVGRRPVVLVTGVMAIGGCVWAGNSHSLGSHLAARSLQAVGAGTVESLIPFILQDMIFVHQRNQWISGIFAAQGLIIIVLGIGSPYMIINISWRFVYFVTAGGAAFFLIGVYFFLPETRWSRSRSEMNGIPRDETGHEHAERTFKYNTQFITGKKEWRKGWNAFVDTLRTFFYPQIFFITMLNSVMIACAFAAGYTVAPALLTAPWSWNFMLLGLCLVPILISSIGIVFVTGSFADYMANRIAKKRGVRVPENQLVNLALPTIAGVVGTVIFGIAGQYPEHYHWTVFLAGLALMCFGFLGANTIGAVYVLECYPHLAGPALVNIASFRCLLAFILSFKVSDWVANMGYLDSMMIYTGLVSAFGLFIPVVYYYGPAWRKRWPADHFGDHVN